MIDTWLYTWLDWKSDSVTGCLYYCPFMFAFYFCLFLVYIFIVYSHIICICTFPFILLTHWVAFWWSWICTSRLNVLLIPRVNELVRFARTRIFFLFDSGILASLLFRLFPNSLYITSNCHFFIISYDIMCGHLYMLLQLSWFIIVDFYSLFWVT